MVANPSLVPSSPLNTTTVDRLWIYKDGEFQFSNGKGSYPFKAEYGKAGFYSAMIKLIQAHLRKRLGKAFNTFMWLFHVLASYNVISRYIRNRIFVDGIPGSYSGVGPTSFRTINTHLKFLEMLGIINIYKTYEKFGYNDKDHGHVNNYSINYEVLHELMMETIRENNMIRVHDLEQARAKKEAQQKAASEFGVAISDQKDPFGVAISATQYNKLTGKPTDQYFGSADASPDQKSEDLKDNSSPYSSGELIMSSAAPADSVPQNHETIRVFGGVTKTTAEVQLNLGFRAEELAEINKNHKAKRAKREAERVNLTPAGTINTNHLIAMFHERSKSEYELYAHVPTTNKMRGQWAKKIKGTEFPDGKNMIDFVEYVIDNWVSIRENHFQYWLNNLDPAEQAKRVYPDVPSIEYVMFNFKVFFNSYVKFLNTGLDNGRLREKLRAAGYTRQEIDEKVKNSVLKQDKVNEESKALERLKQKNEVEKLRLQREVEAMKAQTKRRLEIVAEREAEVRRREMEASNVVSFQAPANAKMNYTLEDLKDLSKNYDAFFSTKFKVEPGDEQRIHNVFMMLNRFGVGKCDEMLETIYRTY